MKHKLETLDRLAVPSVGDGVAPDLDLDLPDGADLRQALGRVDPHNDVVGGKVDRLGVERSLEGINFFERKLPAGSGTAHKECLSVLTEVGLQK